MSCYKNKEEKKEEARNVHTYNFFLMKVKLKQSNKNVSSSYLLV